MSKSTITALIFVGLFSSVCLSNNREKGRAARGTNIKVGSGNKLNMRNFQKIEKKEENHIHTKSEVVNSKASIKTGLMQSKATWTWGSVLKKTAIFTGKVALGGALLTAGVALCIATGNGREIVQMVNEFNRFCNPETVKFVKEVVDSAEIAKPSTPTLGAS